ncbi:MAG: Gfo/Idh/MocA family oxidoreductase [Verrucomicrobia bacterium]|nr:Gfo/Idh/MocA family oxidoreductase [Verrucomicrobiota bacterium]
MNTPAPGPTLSLSRRQFLAGCLAASAAPALLEAAAPNAKLNLAIIGCGGRGGGNLAAVSAENIVALCDVNARNLEAAAAKHPSARKYIDFRKLYDDAKDIDAVVVSTAEHTHAFATLPALELRKHVFCEKPLTHSTWEARVIRQAARRAKVATQMGTQIHAGSNYRRVVELIQSGAIGAVSEVHVWVSRAWGWQSAEAAQRNKDIVFATERPSGSTPVPAGLHWDLWLGPAPERPFHEVYFPGSKWYRWWDFGSGTMSDLGSHWNDLPFWALDLDAPRTVVAQGPPPHPEIAPASMSATYEFGPRGSRPAVQLTWYQGELKPKIWTEGGIPTWGNGVLFIGNRGMLLADYGKHVLLPEEKFKDFPRPEPFIPESLGHHQEWLHACKTGAPTTCHFEYAGALTEANHLGNVAYRTGQKIVWDAASLEAKGVPEAAPIIRRSYRAGWTLGT